MEIPTESASATWTAPQCPFAIEYTPRVLDDIRLAVMDAFFSLPRGGAEIGGVLLGRYENGRVLIQDYAPVPCEHASGPSYVLSARDHAKLADVLATARGNPKGGQPVGWYHSHTRSEIFLSEADLEIHKRYFPEPWQVALVMKPHTFQPMRAGFFFREADGSIRDGSCYEEIVMTPLAVRPMPEAAMASAGASTGTGLAESSGETPAEEDAPVAAEMTPVTTMPAFRREGPKRSYGRWVILVAVLVLALGAWGYRTRDRWLTPPRAEVVYIGLNTVEVDGQLQIRWDRNSSSVRQARDGILIIEDGTKPEAVELDATHLQAGVFSYGRRSPHVDVAMTLNLPDGQKVREATSFLGQRPEKPSDESALRKERDDLAARLQEEQARSRKLERSLQEARNQLQKAQKKGRGR